jgi:hypothetical protein
MIARHHVVRRTVSLLLTVLVFVVVPMVWPR